MLRESVKSKDGSFQLASITDGIRDDGDIPYASLLAQFAEAVVSRSDEDLSESRAEIISHLGGDAFIDAAATASGFHGVVRIADATGIPYLNYYTSEVISEINVDRFYATELGDRA